MKTIKVKRNEHTTHTVQSMALCLVVGLADDEGRKNGKEKKYWNQNVHKTKFKREKDGWKAVELRKHKNIAAWIVGSWSRSYQTVA